MALQRSALFIPDIELDKDSPEPLHLQLCQRITDQILRYRPKSGTRLISERKLAEALELDRSTVHRAYRQLREDGVVREQPPSRSLFISSEAFQKLRRPFPNIGLILPCKFSEFINDQELYRLRYIKGIIDRAADLEYSTMMLNLPPPDSISSYVAEWKAHVVDRLAGLIHFGDRVTAHDLPLQALIEDVNIPQVFISGYSSLPHIGSVIGELEPGAVAAAEYLHEMGHRNVAVVTCCTPSQAPSLFNYEGSSRHRNIITCFKKCHLNIRPNWVLEGCDDEEKRNSFLEAILQASERPTAIWCINDHYADMVIDALQEKGFKVPGDMSVIGYDDAPQPDIRQNITSIRLPFYAIGSSAVDALHDYYENGLTKANRIRKHPTSLTIKSSVGRA